MWMIVCSAVLLYNVADDRDGACRRAIVHLLHKRPGVCRQQAVHWHQLHTLPPHLCLLHPAVHHTQSVNHLLLADHSLIINHFIFIRYRRIIFNSTIC